MVCFFNHSRAGITITQEERPIITKVIRLTINDTCAFYCTTNVINVVLHPPSSLPLVLLAHPIFKPVVGSHIETESRKLLPVFVPLPALACIRIPRCLTTQEECAIITEIVGRAINNVVALYCTTLIVRVVLHAPSFTPTRILTHPIDEPVIRTHVETESRILLAIFKPTPSFVCTNVTRLASC